MIRKNGGILSEGIPSAFGANADTAPISECKKLFLPIAKPGPFCYNVEDFGKK